MKENQLVTNPKTKPPDPDKPLVCVWKDGEETWVELVSDRADGITEADFEFAKPAK